MILKTEIRIKRSTKQGQMITLIKSNECQYNLSNCKERGDKKLRGGGTRAAAFDAITHHRCPTITICSPRS